MPARNQQIVNKFGRRVTVCFNLKDGDELPPVGVQYAGGFLNRNLYDTTRFRDSARYELINRDSEDCIRAGVSFTRVCETWQSDEDVVEPETKAQKRSTASASDVKVTETGKQRKFDVF